MEKLRKLADDIVALGDDALVTTACTELQLVLDRAQKKTKSRAEAERMIAGFSDDFIIQRGTARKLYEAVHPECSGQKGETPRWFRRACQRRGICFRKGPGAPVFSIAAPAPTRKRRHDGSDDNNKKRNDYIRRQLQLGHGGDQGDTFSDLDDFVEYDADWEEQDAEAKRYVDDQKRAWKEVKDRVDNRSSTSGSGSSSSGTDSGSNNDE
jgi:hypothetical protein